MIKYSLQNGYANALSKQSYCSTIPSNESEKQVFLKESVLKAKFSSNHTNHYLHLPVKDCFPCKPGLTGSPSLFLPPMVPKENSWDQQYRLLWASCSSCHPTTVSKH